MIFKTLNGDLTVFNKTLVSTKDHLKSLQTINATVHNKNGVFNLQGLLVDSSQSVSTFTKLNNAFKAYNGNLSKSTQLQNAYVQAVGKQNVTLGNYLAGLNGAKASMGGYVKSLVSAKAASIGLQAASIALNTAISMGITLAISALISAITKWVNKEKEAREEAIENAKTAKEETNNLSELLNKYNQLSKEVKSNQGVKKDLLSVQSDLLEALGIEASQIDTLIEKYGDLNSAINQITLDSLRDAQGDLMVAIDAYEKDLIKVGKGYAHWYSLFDRNLLSTGQSSTDALDILEKARIISSGSHGEGGGALVLTGNDKTVEGILENYQKLKDAQEALNTAIDNGEITMEEMIKIPLYNDINSRLEELEESIGNYNTAIADLNKNMAQQQILKSLAEQSSIPETKEEFEAFQQSMIDTAIASTKFKGNQDDIRDSIINVLSVMPEFKKYFEELNDVQSSTLNNNLFSSFTDTDFGTRIQHITDMFNEGTISHKEYFDALQSEINNFDASNFTDSIEDMNKASAQFFVDSMQQTADGLSGLINSFDNGEMSISEYLEGYLAIGNALSTLTDNLQENSAAWNEHGEAISEVGNTALDDTQDKLNSAMSIIESYQDSIYSLEQIMNDAVTVGSDEFTAHANVIAEDLYRIVQTGGEMADTIANTLGTTTSEIAQSLTENVSNQEIACQAIMANTNNAITDMASSIGELFDTLGDAISNFKVDLSFGVKSIDWKKVNVLGVDLSLPEINFELGASGESLDKIGSALSSFGKTIASNYTPQTIELEDFHFGSTDTAKDRKYSPSSGITKNYESALDKIKDATKSTGSSVKSEFEDMVDFFERRIEVIDNAVSLLKANLENLTGSYAKNQLLAQSSNILEESMRNYSDAIKMYQQKAQASLSKLDLETQKKIIDGSVSLTDYIGEGNKAVVEAINDYSEWSEKVAEHTEKLANLRKELRELELQKFNNVISDFESQFNLRDNSKDLITKQIDLLKEAGELIGESFFTAQIDQSKKQLELLEAEKAQLVNQMSSAIGSGRVKYCPLLQ